MNELDEYLDARIRETTSLSREIDRSATAREILQQPWTWRRTVEQLQSDGTRLERRLMTPKPEMVIFAGAGTSDYVGRAVEEAFRLRRGIPAEARATTDFILRPHALFPTSGHVLMVHFARSGQSPESLETLRIALDVFPDRATHWIVTCNGEGSLARHARTHPSACVVTVLHPATHDRGLAMTSSYSNMVLAGLWLADPDVLTSLTPCLARVAEHVLGEHAATLAEIAQRPFERAFFLGDGALEAAAIESALKMQELTCGRVITKSEAFLAFRHGPISAVTDDSLIVAFFSSNPHVRAYEEDLASQLTTGLRLFMCEEGTPRLAEAADVLIEVPELAEVPDTHRAPIAALIGQQLGYFRARALGIDPDNPAGDDGPYSRVVQGVTIHPYR